MKKLMVVLLTFMFMISVNNQMYAQIFRVADPQSSSGSKSPNDGPPFARYITQQNYYYTNFVYANHQSAVNSAFSSWNNVGTVQYTQTTNTSLPHVDLVGFYSDAGAQMAPRYYPNPGISHTNIVNNIIYSSGSYIELNTFLNWRDDGVQQLPMPNWNMDTETILVHEIGHLHAVAHPNSNSYTHDASAPIMAGGDNEYFWTHAARSLASSDIDATVFLQYNSYVPSQFTTIQEAISNSFYGSTIHVSSGNYTITGSNVEVPTGFALEISAGANINLGTFNIVSTGGTIQNCGSISGIKSYIKSGNAITGYCSSVQTAINYASQNKTVELLPLSYSESPSISSKSNIILSGQGSGSTIINGSIWVTNSNNIQLNGIHIENGVYTNNSQYVSVYACNFPGSNLLCDYGSTNTWVSNSIAEVGSASFAVSSYGGTGNIFYNTIQNFDCGVFLSNNASFNVGDQNIFCNNAADIYAQNGAYGYAISNTYSLPVPQSIYGNVFITGVNSVCNLPKISPYQINEVNLLDSRLLKDADEKYLGLLRKIDGDSKTEKYDKSKYETDYSKLINDYKNVVATEKDKQIVKAALSKLNHLYKAKEDKNSFAAYLNELAASKANQQYLPYIQHYSIWDAVDNNDYNNSISVANAVLKNALDDEDLTCEMLYEKGLIYKYYLKNQAKAEEEFGDLIANHPKHLLAKFASSQSGIALIEQQNFKSVENEEAVSYSLDNYPNPFNPSTTISYSLPQAGHVMLKVYDVLGREVAELVNGVKEKGKHSVMFNASKYASGFYIYTIRVNDFYASKKMLLTK